MLLLLTPLLDVLQFLLDTQTDSLRQFLGDPLEGVEVLHGEDVGVGRGVGDGLQFRPDGVLHAHGEDLDVGVPQPAGGILEGVRGLAVCDEDGEARHVGSGPPAGNEDLLADEGHGLAGVGGAPPVREGLHGSDGGVQVVVCVEVELGVCVPAVLDQTDLDFTRTDIKGLHQILQERPNLSEVRQTDTVRSINQENHISLDIQPQRTF